MKSLCGLLQIFDVEGAPSLSMTATANDNELKEMKDCSGFKRRERQKAEEAKKTADTGGHNTPTDSESELSEEEIPVKRGANEEYEGLDPGRRRTCCKDGNIQSSPGT